MLMVRCLARKNGATGGIVRERPYMRGSVNTFSRLDPLPTE